MNEVISRADWEKLSPKESTKFFAEGGRVVDHDPKLKPKPFPELPNGQMYRHEWEKLGFIAKSQFLRDGGKVVDAPPVEYEDAV